MACVKDKRGLGVKNLSVYNSSLFGKWRWRLLVENGALWCNLLREKYGDNISPILSHSYQS